MPRKRVPASERKALILEAARKVFAESGYEGAKTQRIAAVAKISEALVYRHYPSKEALYRAVLRQLIREQDASYEKMYLPEATTAGLIKSIRNYVELSLSDTGGRMQEGLRMLLASLAGEGGYASLVYRRAQRKMQHQIEAAINAARAAGDLHERGISIRNLALFQEHIGTMLTMLSALPNRDELYDRDSVLQDAILFCCRGVGLTEEAIGRHLGR